MSPMSNKCLSIWSSLIRDTSTAVFKRYDSAHMLDFYLGLDQDGAQLMLLVSVSEPTPQPDMKGVRFRKTHRDDGKWSLLLSLKDRQLIELFSMLCQDLIDSSRGRTQADGFSLVLKRLGSWRKLLERNASTLLGEAEVRGLLGELTHLKNLMGQIGVPEAVDVWNGPFGSPQDFSSDGWGCEVKAIRPSARFVNIASEYQLDNKASVITLVIYEVAECGVEHSLGLSLGGMVEDLRDSLSMFPEAQDGFDERILLAGYIERQEYHREKFLVSAPSVYKVVQGFPHLLKDDLPTGVCEVKYKIELSALCQFKA
ncbi:MAG: PD-(D/E)XK motif protein [Proteobacteria bacterium]|nr:MAG: PD-(D/E)XK motif protein [Pseudomonadota bacterium]